MIKYTCTISASKDVRGAYETFTVDHVCHYPIPDNTLRKIIIDKLPKEYVSFGHVTYKYEVI